VITASADKLLGGPQAGLILGDTAHIDRIVRHPLARALRVDKLTLAALEATLRLYRDPQRARQAIPTLRYLSRTETELRAMARKLKGRLAAVLPSESFRIDLRPERSEVGGGSRPADNLPTVCVAIASSTGRPSAAEIARTLRRAEPPVFARIKADEVLLDPRTLEINEFGLIASAVANLLSGPRE
jgi:L-seryl-tRNA(Ser) seleniumtransferase